MIETKKLGDAAIQVSFGDKISEDVHREIQQFISKLKEVKIKGIIEWVPAYCTVAIYYRPEVISHNRLVQMLKRIYSSSSRLEPIQRLIYEIPVYYGGYTGPDLTYVAQYHHLREEEVIHLHTSKEYLIYMMGFVPGFPYLGGLSPKLAVPRLEHPRTTIKAGSVGIGGNQTGIYPAEVPSGWRIIGITPVKLFDVQSESPFLFTAGNYIKFNAIDFNEFKRIQELAAKKIYNVNILRKVEHHDCHRFE
jgi:inhibitor of KinA